MSPSATEAGVGVTSAPACPLAATAPRRASTLRIALGAAARATLLAFFLALVGLLLGIGPVSAQDISINFGQSTSVSERAVQLVALITLLSIAPSIVVMVTSFKIGRASCRERVS
jgi:flagellar biosynthetic protein FliP